MKASPELREKMWELCYDLLPDGERSALIAQIKSDPHAARLYAEVRLQADLVGFAATVEDSSLILSADAEKLKTLEAAPAASRRKEAAQPPVVAARGKKSLWAANAVALAAGLALVLVMAVGFFRPSDMGPQLTQLVVTEIEVPGQLTSGVTTDFVVHTQSPTRDPVGVPLNVQVVNQFGEVLHREEIQTAADGRGKVEVPGEAMVPGVRLQVEARSEEFAEQQVAQQAAGESQGLGANFVEANLPVTRQEPLAYILVEKPAAHEGEQVRIAKWGIDRFGLVPAAPTVGDVVVKGLESTRLMQPQWSVTDNVNVAEGTIELSGSPPQEDTSPRAPALAEKTELREQLSLLRIELAQDFSEAAKFRSSGASPPLPATETPAPGQSQQRRYADTLEASQKSASAAADERIDDLDRTKQDAAKQNVALRHRRVIAAGQPVEVEVSADQAGKSLEAKVMARGVEVVRQRVEPQIERFIKDGKQREESAKITLDVPPEVDGNLDVTVFESSAAGAKVVHEQQLYRTPARELKFQTLNLKRRYDPGERVQLQLKIVNENDEPQVASLGARLWNEDYVPDDREGLVMLADVVRQQESRDAAGEPSAELAQFGRQRSGVEGAVALGGSMPGSRGALPPGEADKEALPQLAGRDDRQPLSDLKKAEEPAAGATGPSAPTPPAHSAPAPAGPTTEAQLARTNENALGSLAMPADPTVGGAGAGVESDPASFAVPAIDFYSDAGPVTVASNKAAIDRQVQSLKSESSRAVAVWQAAVGRVLIGGGLVALIILGLLFVMHQQVRWSSGTLALVASAASLVIGAVWISGGRQEMTIAMAPSRGPNAANDALPSPAEAAPAMSRRAGISTKIAQESLHESTTSGDASAAPAGQALPAAAPAPLKEVDGVLKSQAPVAAPLAAAAPAEKSEDEGKGTTGSTEKLAPAKPAPAAIRPSGKNQENPAEEEQVGDKRTLAAPAPAGGRGGFGGGLGSGGKARGGPGTAGLGGAPGTAPADPRKDSVDRPSPPQAATMRAGGTAAPASTSPAPAPAAPEAAADAPRDLNRGSEGEKRKTSNEAAAPSAIYFNPQLTTDKNGIVTLEFQMPAVASEYRLLLDAYGSGRIGSSADVRIVCQAAE